MFYLFIFLLIICTTSQHIDGASLSSRELHIKYGSQALNALRRLLNYFESDAQNVNVDGLYGLRIAQGQLIALDRHLTSSGSVTDKKQIIHSLSNQIEHIANISLNQIQRETPFYLHRFALIVNQPFLIEYQSKQIHRHFIQHGERDSSFDEEQSDQCFAELLVSSERLNATKCSISQSCWNMITSSMTKDYRLTHQLLWFLIAKDIGCIAGKLANKKLNYFEDYFCANIYQDAQHNLVNNINQDLFLEQLLLCSIIGYEDFLRIDWFHTVLTWQHPDYDCFSHASEDIRFHSRNLLMEQEMNNGCLAHKSGLAAGLLATYSRVFLAIK